MFFGWEFFLISLGGQAPHVRCTPMGRTCGGPDDTELTPIGVELNGPLLVPLGPVVLVRGLPGAVQ